MTFSLKPHTFDAGNGRSVAAELGSLTVPMNRSAPSRGTVELAFVRLPAITSNPGPPIIFLNGGPGLSGIRAGSGRLFALFDALRAAGDVILLDQRGSGASTPLLQCGDTLHIPFIQRMETLLRREDAVRRAIQMAQQCAEQLTRDGVDVSAFNTQESADDVAALAHALQAPRIALLGWSYGTHLAFAVLRRHGELVARAVLAGPEGPDHTYKLPSRIEQYLGAIAERARADMPHLPDLRTLMAHVFRAVESEPVSVPTLHSAVGGVNACVGRFDLEWMTAQGIADTRMLSRLPRWYARMARGQFNDIGFDEILVSYYETLHNDKDFSLLRSCMDCASGVSHERWNRIEREAGETLLGRTVDFPVPEVRDVLGMPDLGDAFRASLHSDTPVLFVTGTLDARTPAENAHELMPGFANASHITVEDAGHTDLLHAPAVRAAAVRFLQGVEVESARVAAAHPFQFEPLGNGSSSA